MQGKPTDIKIGEKIGMCTLLSFAPIDRTKKSRAKRGVFLCDCGNEFTTTLEIVKKGKTRSCGCYNKSLISQLKVTYEKGTKFGDLVYLNEAGKDMSNGRLCSFLCVCGEEFSTRLESVKTGSTKSCGCLTGKLLSEAGTKHAPVEYIKDGLKKLPLLDAENIHRFWNKVAITANPDLCWNWQNTGERYGGFRVGKAMYKSNRIAYFLYYGVDPAELSVLHSCDNPKCCNPNHLSLGTHQDNMADMVNKGRANNQYKNKKNVI